MTVLGRPYVQLSEIGKIVNQVIPHIQRDDVAIDHYVIMPDHIHMIICNMKACTNLIYLIASNTSAPCLHIGQMKSFGKLSPSKI